MKKKRCLAIQLKAEELIRWLDIGSRFLSQTLNLNTLREIFLNFCHGVGIREINKLWVT